jgi:hypothetical protein
MPPVFGRSSSNLHLYDAVLDEWLATGDRTHRAMARNIMHDHRVTPEREREFLRIAGVHGNETKLEEDIVDYHKEHVRDAKAPPPFVDEAQNGPNILTHSPRRPDEPHPDREFGRILKLSSLGLIFDWAQDRDEKFGALRRERNENVIDWLDKKLGEARAIESFVQIALDAVNFYLSEEGPYQPSWCAPWEDLEPYLAEGPDRWAEIVGIPSTGEACWVQIPFSLDSIRRQRVTA